MTSSSQTSVVQYSEQVQSPRQWPLCLDPAQSCGAPGIILLKCGLDMESSMITFILMPRLGCASSIFLSMGGNVSVWKTLPKMQLHRRNRKALHCASYIQLPSQCLEMRSNIMSFVLDKFLLYLIQQYLWGLHLNSDFQYKVSLILEIFCRPT